MAIQKNVDQQNRAVKEEIAGAADAGRCGRFRWLPKVIGQCSLSFVDGLLVQLTEIPDQGGRIFKGMWLTTEKRFWCFEVLVSRESDEIVEIERVEDMTAKVSTSGNRLGTGKSFGMLAMEVMDERLGAGPSSTPVLVANQHE